jgi:hypothetical protein
MVLVLELRSPDVPTFRMLLMLWLIQLSYAVTSSLSRLSGQAGWSDECRARGDRGRTQRSCCSQMSSERATRCGAQRLRCAPSAPKGTSV